MDSGEVRVSGSRAARGEKGNSTRDGSGSSGGADGSDDVVKEDIAAAAAVAVADDCSAGCFLFTCFHITASRRARFRGLHRRGGPGDASGKFNTHRATQKQNK